MYKFCVNHVSSFVSTIFGFHPIFSKAKQANLCRLPKIKSAPSEPEPNRFPFSPPSDSPPASSEGRHAGDTDLRLRPQQLRGPLLPAERLRRPPGGLHLRERLLQRGPGPRARRPRRPAAPPRAAPLSGPPPFPRSV